MTICLHLLSGAAEGGQVQEPHGAAGRGLRALLHQPIFNDGNQKDCVGAGEVSIKPNQGKAVLCVQDIVGDEERVDLSENIVLKVNQTMEEYMEQARQVSFVNFRFCQFCGVR